MRRLKINSPPTRLRGLGTSLSRIRRVPEGALIVLPLRSAVLFPGIVAPLGLGRPQSIAGAQAAARADKPIGVLLQSDPSIETPGPANLHKVGTVAEILRYVTAPDGSHHVVTRGIRRFRVLDFLPDYPYLVAKVEEVGEAEIYSTEIAARVHQLKERAREAIGLMPNIPAEISAAIEQMESPAQLADFVANVSDLTPAEKQDLLETFDVQERLDKLLRILAQQIEVLKLSKQIGEQTQESCKAASASTSCASSSGRFKRSSARARTAKPRSPSCARPSTRRACPRRPRSRR